MMIGFKRGKQAPRQIAGWLFHRPYPSEPDDGTTCNMPHLLLMQWFFHRAPRSQNLSTPLNSDSLNPYKLTSGQRPKYHK